MPVSLLRPQARARRRYPDPAASTFHVHSRAAGLQLRILLVPAALSTIPSLRAPQYAAAIVSLELAEGFRFSSGQATLSPDGVVTRPALARAPVQWPECRGSLSCPPEHIQPRGSVPVPSRRTRKTAWTPHGLWLSLAVVPVSSVTLPVLSEAAPPHAMNHPHLHVQRTFVAANLARLWLLVPVREIMQNSCVVSLQPHLLAGIESNCKSRAVLFHPHW